MPELYSQRWDWLREFYVDATVPIKDDRLSIRLGKQQVIWGRTDLFRVLDIINPVDYSRNNIYDELEDIRIPMWILKTEYRFGPDRCSWMILTFSLCGILMNSVPASWVRGARRTRYLNAGSFFRGMKNLWDNGGYGVELCRWSPGALNGGCMPNH